MRTVLRWIGLAVVLLAAAAGVALVLVARSNADTLVTSARDDRRPLRRTPADLGLPFTDVSVRTSDGLTLAGWELPSRNGAIVMAQHGYKVDRSRRILDVAEVVYRQGYGVLLTSVRAHDDSDGELITFGREEMKDLQAWYAHLRSTDRGRDARVGIVGNSMGGSLAIQFAALEPGIEAVVAHSAFSSLLDTVDTSLRAFTGLPPFPFVPLIRFWMERRWGFDAAMIDFTTYIDDLAPRPVLLLHGGVDSRVSPASGHRLLEAAGENAELWFEPDLDHASFHTKRPEQFRRRVIGFLDRHLLSAGAPERAGVGRRRESKAPLGATS